MQKVVVDLKDFMACYEIAKTSNMPVIHISKDYMEVITPYLLMRIDPAYIDTKVKAIDMLVPINNKAVQRWLQLQNFELLTIIHDVIKDKQNKFIKNLYKFICYPSSFTIEDYTECYNYPDKEETNSFIKCPIKEWEQHSALFLFDQLEVINKAMKRLCGRNYRLVVDIKKEPGDNNIENPGYLFIDLFSNVHITLMPY